jgi:hypothetical protein
VSDTFLRLFAADPDYVPDPITTTRAKEVAEHLFPDADDVEVEVYPRVTLIDCGENLTVVTCPHCGAEHSFGWWADEMDRLAAGDLWDAVDVEATMTTPCCEGKVTLRTLQYNWPTGFARFSVDVRNPAPWPDQDPNISAKALGHALGVEMHALWAHY